MIKYHGTLRRNIASIKQDGLLSRTGILARDYHEDAVDHVYAVSEDRKGRLIRIITHQMGIAGLVSLTEGYQFNDFKNDLAAHGAVFTLNQIGFVECDENGNPPGAEMGDWYKKESVSVLNIRKVIVGQRLLDWLNPNEVDFKYRDRAILHKWCVDSSSLAFP